MPAPLAGILARIGASLFGRAAAAGAGTRAGAGVASAGASMAERVSVLKKADTLMTRAAVASRIGKDPLDVSVSDRVALSERVAAEGATQESREKEKATENTSQFGQAMKIATIGLIAFPIAFKKLLDAVDGITTGILEKQRELAPLSGQIASAFAKLELRTRTIQVERAGAVGGSTAMLADAIGDLRETIEPMRQTFVTLVNILATGTAKFAQLLVILAEYSPTFKAAVEIAKKIEESQRKEAAGPFIENWNAMLRGNFAANHGLPLGREQDEAPRGEGRAPPNPPAPQPDPDEQARNRDRRRDLGSGLA